MNVRHWFRTVAVAYLGFIVAVLALVFVARRGAQLSVVVAVASGVLLATLWLDDVMRQVRSVDRDAAREARIWVAVFQLSLGVCLLWWRAVGPGGDASAFLGFVVMLLAVGAFIAEWRFSMRWVTTRGRVLLGLALLLALIGTRISGASAKWGLLAVGVALVLGYLGTEVYSEDWVRRVSRPHRWTMAGAGAVLLFGVGFMLIRSGGYPLYVVAALIAVVLLVAAAASDSNTVGVVLVIVIAVIWATAPRSPGDVPDVDPKAGERAFIAFGDSYMSGEGATAFFEGTNVQGVNECRRAPTAFAELLADHAPGNVPSRLFFLACSGAKGTDIFATRQNQSVNQVDRYREMAAKAPGEIAFALISIGGNDANFGVIGKTCVPPGDCSEIGQRFLDDMVKPGDELEPKLKAAYAAIIEATHGKVPIIAVPYPEPVRQDKCEWSTLTENEHRFLYGYVRELNRVVFSAATASGIYFMDTMSTALAEKDLRICDSHDPRKLGVNFIAANPQRGTLSDALNPLSWTHNSLHPNARGHRAMLAAAKEWFALHGELQPPSPAVGGAAPAYRVRSLDEIVGDPPVERCGRGDLRLCNLGTAQWQLAEIVLFMRRVLLPMLVALVAAWLLVMPLIQLSTERNLSTFKVLRRLWGRPEVKPRRLLVSPTALAVDFIDCINLRDSDGLATLMTADHQLVVLDEPPLVGRDANVTAWRGYFKAFPRYVIYPHRIAEEGSVAAVLGHTTGSHLGLRDAQESTMTLIWLVEAHGGAVARWQLIEDTPVARQAHGLL